jgi:hypothetical protein
MGVADLSREASIVVSKLAEKVEYMADRTKRGQIQVRFTPV